MPRDIQVRRCSWRTGGKACTQVSGYTMGNWRLSPSACPGRDVRYWIRIDVDITVLLVKWQIAFTHGHMHKHRHTPIIHHVLTHTLMWQMYIPTYGHTHTHTRNIQCTHTYTQVTDIYTKQIMRRIGYLFSYLNTAINCLVTRNAFTLILQQHSFTDVTD